MYAVIPENDPLAKEEEIPIEVFEGAPFIITEYTPGSDVHRVLRKNKIHPDIRYVTRNEFSSLSMVEHELGYSILQVFCSVSTRKFVKRPLKPTITRQLGLAYSSLEDLSPASKTFLEYAKNFLLDDLIPQSCCFILYTLLNKQKPCCFSERLQQDFLLYIMYQMHSMP